MRKGTAFSDLRLINGGYKTLGTATLYEYDTVDLEFGGEKFFNSFRINMTMANFLDVANDFWISFRLYHGDEIGVLSAITAADIIGPIDSDGNPTIGTDGEWKRLQTDTLPDPDDDFQDQGYQVYSVGYIGLKRYVKTYVHTKGDIVVTGKIVWCLIAGMHIHTGKCYDRYKLIGSDGGQIRYGTSI